MSSRSRRTDIIVCTLLLVLVHTLSGAMSEQQQQKGRRRTIMLFGIAGVGKSTISNCILNRKGDMESIQDGGFQVSEDAGSGTLKFELKSNDQFTIIDSIGFGSPDFNASYILAQMRGVLNKVNNRIDLVLFVIKKGRLTNDTYQFIRTFQEEVMGGKARLNSALLVNQCEKGWLNKSGQQSNAFMRAILASVANMSLEFELKLDHWSDDERIKERNAAIRQHSIDELVRFLDMWRAEPITLEHIQTAEFETRWLHVLYSYLESLAQCIARSFSGAFSTDETTTSTRKGNTDLAEPSLRGQQEYSRRSGFSAQAFSLINIILPAIRMIC